MFARRLSMWWLCISVLPCTCGCLWSNGSVEQGECILRRMANLSIMVVECSRERSFSLMLLHLS